MSRHIYRVLCSWQWSWLHTVLNKDAMHNKNQIIVDTGNHYRTIQELYEGMILFETKFTTSSKVEIDIKIIIVYFYATLYI